MITLIKNGTIFYEGRLQKKDILIEDDLFIEISDKIEKDADKEIDVHNKYVFPGFIDLHTHLRDPGLTHKEDIITGTKSAAKGGFTTICCMPNTNPVIDNIAGVEYIKRKSNDVGGCKVKIIGAMTKQSEGKEISEMASMKEAGIIAVSDDGRCVQNSKLMLNCMKYASNFNLPVIVHPEDYNLAGNGQINSGKVSTQIGLGGIPAIAEEIIIARDVMLAESSKCHLHIAHISTKKSVDLVREAKEKGINVTCEVTPHHLLLTEEACMEFDTNTKMKPPLRTELDRLACLEALKDGTIDFIATDHAPHADYEKEREFVLAPFGIITFETTFCSLYNNLVLSGDLELEKLIEFLTVKPAKFLKENIGEIKEGYIADLNIVSLDKKTDLSIENILSKSKNTPFINQQLLGLVETTICDGVITWQV